MGLVWLCFHFIFFHSISGQPNLWPLPQEYTNGSDTIKICNSNFTFTANIASSEMLNNAFTRFSEYLLNSPEILRTTKVFNVISGAEICSANILVADSDETLSINTNESYALSINTSNIIITSQTIYGAMYGLITLQQLIRFDPTSTNSNILRFVPWNINDFPVYKHRGILLDTSRNFLSVNLIKNVLNGMALNKLNVFHWHIIDATSFPFYSKTHPELSEYGAYSTDKIYYESNITEIIQYAKNLGIRCVPEFDTPGHTWAISLGQPDIMECTGVSDNYWPMCPEPPCGYVDTSDRSYNVILDIFKDAYDLFDDSFFHIGADEISDECWGSNTTEMYLKWIETMCKDVYFVGNKTPILWSGFENVEADIGQNEFDVVIQVWDNEDLKLKALENGFKIIDSIYTSYYLDCGFGSWLALGNSWCDPYKGWTTIYNHSLTDNIPQEYIKNILGGEVCLWGESVDGNNLQPRLWPRAASAAERWWRNEPLQFGDKINNAYHRFAINRDWMVHNGIIASPVHPEFCTLYPDYCHYYRDSMLNPVPSIPETNEPSTEPSREPSIAPTAPSGCKDNENDNNFGSTASIIMFFIGIITGFIIIGIIFIIWKKCINKSEKIVVHQTLTEQQSINDDQL